MSANREFKASFFNFLFSDTEVLRELYSALELAVKVLNINQGRNEGIARGCKTLAGYQAFVAKAREYVRRGCGLEDALKKTVLYCRGHDILKETLEQHEKEVIGMLATEWNWEDALAVRFEEGMEQGMAEGFDQGMEEGIEQGMEQGFDRGMAEGMKDVALNALAEGLPLEVVQKITGLDLLTIESLRE